MAERQEVRYLPVEEVEQKWPGLTGKLPDRMSLYIPSADWV